MNLDFNSATTFKKKNWVNFPKDKTCLTSN